MCDYSLHNVKSRPAKVGDKLTTHNFNTGTRGFAAPEDVRTAVCVLPGTELAFTKEVRCGQSRLFGWKANTVNHTTAIFRQITRTTREHIMMRWNFQTGRSCSSLMCSKVRKQRCSSFRHNPLPQPRRRLRNESRTSAESQAATVLDWAAYFARYALEITTPRWPAKDTTPVLPRHRAASPLRQLGAAGQQRQGGGDIGRSHER